VYVTGTAQCELSPSSAVRVQVGLLKVPASGGSGSRLKVTVPEGALFVPLSVSSTTASQLVGWLTATVSGVQVTVVVVVRSAAAAGRSATRCATQAAT
jgi:hypothetical protein